ncbi:hypothetical protein [Leptothoe spongobia]|nr:hypothetical protein [Leptothoe spongobia]
MAAVAVFKALEVSFSKLVPALKKLPPWARFLIFAVPVVMLTLLSILFIGLLFGIIWIVYEFISSGIWKSIPAEVGASIIAGLFAVLTLMIGNYLTKKNEIETALEIKRIEEREAARVREDSGKLKKEKLYSEIINKLTVLLSDGSLQNEALSSFYGRLYTQGSSEIISDFLEIAQVPELLTTQGPVQSIDIYNKVNVLIGKLRNDLGFRNSRDFQLSYMFIPLNLNKE